MESQELRDLYTDYLIVQNHYATVTGCTELVNDLVSHDSFTRMLSKYEYEVRIFGSKLKTLYVNMKMMKVYSA